MRILVNTFPEMKEKILESKKKIVIYGAGMIGSITTMSILEELNLKSRVAFFVDGDIDKQGSFVENIPVCSKERLKEIHSDAYVLFIALSRFSDVLEELNTFDNLIDMDCYIVPMLCIENYMSSSEMLIAKESDIPCIPKVIHYMWIGKKPVPKVLQKCIDSWKEFCPDYELKLWNEDNYDIEKNPYMKQAYEAKAYGFVPDYARIDILYHHGGIYFDTDVELVRNIDHLLYQKAFCCVEKWQTVNFGGGSGAMPRNQMLGELLRERGSIRFVEANGRLNKNTCGYYDTKFFMKHGYKINGKIQSINGVTVYPSEVFHPYDYTSGRVTKTANTCGIHHFNGGWLDEQQTQANQITMQNYERIFAEAIKA